MDHWLRLQHRSRVPADHFPPRSVWLLERGSAQTCQSLTCTHCTLLLEPDSSKPRPPARSATLLQHVARRAVQSLLKPLLAVKKVLLEVVSAAPALFQAKRFALSSARSGGGGEAPEEHSGLKYYKRNNQCDKCDSRCQLCSGPGLDSCLECPTGIFQVEGTTHCVSKCPERFYIHGNKCKKCHPSCRTCNDSSVQGCKTCDRGSSFKAGICYPQCEEHRYLDDDSVCQPCDPSCRHCSGPGSDHCISCNSKTAWSPEEMRCINCCDSEADQNDCCFCDVNSVLCIKHLQLEAEQDSLKNLKFPASSTVSLSPHFSAVAPVLVSLLLIIAVALLSIWGVKSKKMLCWKQSYERLADSPQDVSCQDEDCKQEYEEDEENLGECDVVYSTKDGTVYKKLPFKIHTAESGLLNNEDCMNKV